MHETKNDDAIKYMTFLKLFLHKVEIYMKKSNQTHRIPRRMKLLY